VSDRSGGLRASAVAVAAADVYWLNIDPGDVAATLMKVSRAGGAPSMVASNLSALANIASNGSKVCWTANDAVNTVTCIDACN
jgi:hypothetical protein